MADEVAIEGIDIPAGALFDRAAYIETARRGVPGRVVGQAVGVLGHRETFASLMGTTVGNLNRFYRRTTLGAAQSEALLDMLRVVSRGLDAFGDLDGVQRWFDTASPALGDERPIDLCDTFEGRRAIDGILHKIQYGEFP